MPALRLRTRWQIGLRYSGLPTTVRAVAWALSTWMDPDGNGCRPLIEDLASAVMVDRSTTFRALARLDGAGWIERRRGGGRGHATTFVPTLPAWADEIVEERLGNGRTGATVGITKPSHLGTETVAGAHPNGRASATHFLPSLPSRVDEKEGEPLEPLDPDVAILAQTSVREAFETLRRRRAAGSA